MTKSKPLILFRADGDSNIGLGHIFRCIAIAERLKNEFCCKFAIADPSESILELLSQNGFPVAALPQIHYNRPDSRALNEEVGFDLDACLKGDEIVVLDGYWFGESYQRSIKKKGCKLVCIDDSADQKYWADIVINHADGINDNAILVIPGGRVYTGFKYALLREYFINFNREGRKIDSISNCVICFGGADFENNTLKVLNAAIEAFYFKTLQVIVGSAYTHRNYLYEFAATQPNVTVHQNLPTGKLIEVLGNSEIAIVPASTIAMECRAVGMMIITGTTAHNQVNLLKGLELQKFVRSIGDFNSISNSDLSKNIQSFISDFRGYTFAPKILTSDPIVDIFKSLL
jgi:UDP-2,4-diacetamido-2,4,6-trideoxy-beta-L-altropyranose hydrolase